MSPVVMASVLTMSKPTRNVPKKHSSLPLWVSYPRSGSRWVKLVTATYYGKAGGSLYVHDHDRSVNLSLPHENILYLYRNPDNVVFSLMRAESIKNTDENVAKEARRVRDHYAKYFAASKQLIRYERFQQDFAAEFAKVALFFTGKPDFDKEILGKCLKCADKPLQMGGKQTAYFNKGILLPGYEKERQLFREKFGDLVWRTAVPPELRQHFL
jgi:hypothetical protein